MKNRLLANYFSLRENSTEALSQTQRFGASLTSEIPNFIGLCLFFGVSYAAFFLFEPTNSPIAQLVFLASLICIAIIRSFSICSHILLSPTISGFRFFPLGDEAAQSINKLTITTVAYIVSVLMFSAVTLRLGAERQTVVLLQLFFATILLAGTGFGVYLSKERVKKYIISSNDGEAASSGWGRNQFASVWHILAILYLILIWVLLIQDIAKPDTQTRGAFFMSFFIVPLWMIADNILQWLVKYSMQTLNIHQSNYADAGDVEEEILLAREKGKALYLKTKNLARTGLIGAMGIWVASMWNINIPFVSTLAAVTIDALIIFALALIFWRFISTWIERKIEESQPEEEEEEEDSEWGGAANRGRSFTLLPMIRKFIASVLVIMVTMTILSSIGVDIGPLLAGAGVLGLAIGFGAQKLVSDMFSGFFYLLDDAFRVGEYMTAGSVSGTVEAITLRNVMLRHHRGMLQIVPHSELGAITNFMRGGMIVKFNLDFPYDANIEKIRKVIKKVGKTMLEDEQLGKDFIQPVKSQGVREITNSVMTIRVKFTAQPGTHFVIRREAYRRVTEALNNAGISYAHKKVIVDVPGLNDAQGGTTLDAQDVKKVTDAAGAAALSSLNDDAVAAQQKKDIPA